MRMMARSRVATAPVYAVLPAKDLARAEHFYGETLGFEIEKAPDALQFMVRAGEGCSMLVYQTAATAGTATQATFEVSDLDSTVADLREHGITFEEYDLPGLKTVNGIATMGAARGAWFKDSEGNTLSVAER